MVELAPDDWVRVQGDGTSHDDGLDAVLAAGGFLVDEGCDELALVLDAQARTRSATDRLELTITPTVACNLRCGYCPEVDKRSRSMDELDEQRVLEFATARMAHARSLFVTWFGGEPLLRPDPLVRMSARLARLCTFRGVSYGSCVITNGTLLTEDMARDLRKAGVHAARITIDGPRDVHDTLRPTAGGRGSFDEVLRGVEIARHHFDTAIGVNLSKANVRSVPALLDELARRDLTDVTVFFARVFDPDGSATTLPVGRYARHEVELLDRARSLGLRVPRGGGSSDAVPCSAVKHNHFVLEPGGDVKRCYTEVTDASKSVGAVNAGEFHPTVRDEVWMDHELTDEGCRACAYLPLCHGGCPKLKMGMLDKEREVCTPRKFNLGELVRRGLW